MWGDASIDTALVATPPSSHFALAPAALRAGKHCRVEKPLALRAAEARELVELAARQRALTFYEYLHPDPSSVPSNVVPIERFAASESIEGGSEEPLTLAAAAFVEAVRTGEPAPSDGRCSLRVVELLEAGSPIA